MTEEQIEIIKEKIEKLVEVGGVANFVKYYKYEFYFTVGIEGKIYKICAGDGAYDTIYRFEVEPLTPISEISSVGFEVLEEEL
jgi:hypothetical protein